uniref:LigA n=1 Tax=Parastrongyloides trichosuri TaxID=131310 RepID=A0A0N5A4T1_PARTI
MAGRATPQPGRPDRGGPSVSAGLFRRDRLGVLAVTEAVVFQAEVAPLFPASAGRPFPRRAAEDPGGPDRRAAGSGGQGLRRHRPPDGEAASPAGGAGLAGQAHQSAQPHPRQLAVPGDHTDRRRDRGGRGRGRALRPLHRLSGRLSDAGLSGAVPDRRPTLPLLPDHRICGRLAARVPHRDGQPHLRLRRLPGRLPVEQVRAGSVGDAAAGPRCAEVAAAGRPAGAGRPRLPRPVHQEPGQADRPRPVHSQCALCSGELGRGDVDRGGRAAAGRSGPRGARGGGVARAAGRMRGLAALRPSKKGLPPWRNPSSVRLRLTPSPARGEGRSAHRLAHAAPPAGHRGHVQQLEAEHQHRIAGDHRRATHLAVAQLGRQEENPLVAGLHQLQGLGPAGHHALGREDRRGAALERAVEHRAVGQRAFIVDPDQVVAIGADAARRAGGHDLVLQAGRQGGADFLGMTGIAGLDHDVELGSLGGHVQRQPVVHHVDDVAAPPADHGGHGRQHAGAVVAQDAIDDQPLLADHFTVQHHCQHAGVDIAAGQLDADLHALETLRVGQDGGQAAGPGALGHRLLQRRQEGHALFEVGLFADEDLVDQAVGQGEGDFSHGLDGDALGDGLPAALGRFAATARGEGRIAGGLDAEDLDARLDRLGGDGAARDQAAAADGDDQGVQVRRVLQKLQAADPLPRDDALVVEGRDEDIAVLGLKPLGLLGRAGEVEAVDDDVGAVGAGAVHLHEGGALGHDDGHRHAQAAAVIGQGLGVVAGRGGDDAALLLIRRQLQQPVQGAALLEAAGEVQVVVLDPDLRPSQLRQTAGVADGRAVDLTGDAFLRLADVVDGDGHEVPDFVYGRPLSSGLRPPFGTGRDGEQP